MSTPVSASKEFGKLLGPVCLGIGIEPVREGSDARPNHSLVNGTILLQENALVTSANERVVSHVILTLSLGSHCRVHHDDVVLVMLMEVVDILANTVNWEAVWVGGHNVSPIHVVDISPHCFERDTGHRVVVDKLQQ
jgi:hypothetical protein